MSALVLGLQTIADVLEAMFWPVPPGSLYVMNFQGWLAKHFGGTWK